jgi:hypothetical protein
MHLPIALPKGIGRLYFLFQKPIVTAGREEEFRDRTKVEDLYKHVKSEVETALHYLQVCGNLCNSLPILSWTRTRRAFDKYSCIITILTFISDWYCVIRRRGRRIHTMNQAELFSGATRIGDPGISHHRRARSMDHQSRWTLRGELMPKVLAIRLVGTVIRNPRTSHWVQYCSFTWIEASGGRLDEIHILERGGVGKNGRSCNWTSCFNSDLIEQLWAFLCRL